MGSAVAGRQGSPATSERLPFASSTRSMPPTICATFDRLPEIGSKRCEAISRGSIASESTSNGASLFDGRVPMRMMFVSSTITKVNRDMQPKNRVPTHPGEILREDFLVPLGQTQVALAEHIGVSVQRVNELVRGKRGVTPETAWLLSQAFGTSPEFWLNLQAAHDLAASRPRRTIRRLKRSSRSAA